MKKSTKRMLLTTLALALVILSVSTALAQSEASVILSAGDKGVVLKDAAASAETPYSDYAYIEERHEALGDFDDWSLEDKAGFSAWMAAQGLPQDEIVHGIPGEGNMIIEDVVELAKKVVLAKYDVKEEVLDDMFKVQVTFNVIRPEKPLWAVEYRVKDGIDVNDLGYYRVEIDDQTGEIGNVYSITDAKG
ncbi:hypothetical protein LJC74_03545 [Eubacteriales bacterium OttesenSCG-928-A19]|nr:hypothetical protein [Eubacteriales bacterium OttesenSCG-928-A19]